jgi:hypothetical protein
MLLYAGIAAAWAMLLYPVVITQPVTIVSQLLANHKFVTDGAVITTLEAITGIFISISLLDNYFMPKNKRKKSLYLLKIMPGILFFFSIAYFELLFFKWRVGSDFLSTAFYYAAVIAIVIFLLSCLIRFLVPGESMKLELKILLNIAILIIGLLINSAIADYNLSHAEISVAWEAMFTLLGLAVILFITGRYIPIQKIKKFIKQR